MRISARFATRTLAATCGLFVAACGDDSGTDVKSVAPVVLKNQSVTPALAKSLISGVEIYSLIGSDDQQLDGLRDRPHERAGGVHGLTSTTACSQEKPPTLTGPSAVHW